MTRGRVGSSKILAKVLSLPHEVNARVSGASGGLWDAEITALGGSADQMALGAMAWLRDQAIDAPGEVSVAGFNDADVASHLTPALTTVRLSLRKMGEAA